MYENEKLRKNAKKEIEFNEMDGDRKLGVRLDKNYSNGFSSAMVNTTLL